MTYMTPYTSLLEPGTTNRDRLVVLPDGTSLVARPDLLPLYHGSTRLIWDFSNLVTLLVRTRHRGRSTTVLTLINLPADTLRRMANGDQAPQMLHAIVIHDADELITIPVNDRSSVTLHVLSSGYVNSFFNPDKHAVTDESRELALAYATTEAGGFTCRLTAREVRQPDARQFRGRERRVDECVFVQQPADVRFNRPLQLLELVYC